MKYIDLKGLDKFLQGIREMFSEYVTIRENEENEKVIAASLNELKETKQDVIDDIDTIRNAAANVGNLSELETDDKNSIVSAVNENCSKVSVLGQKVENIEGLVTSEIIPSPVSPVVIRVTSDFPSQKGDVKSGNASFTFDGRIISCYIDVDIQGQSSSAYEKKNISMSLRNDNGAYFIKIGSIVSSANYVWKANYIDKTQCRNLVCNRLWGRIAAGRGTISDKKGYVDGVPAILYFNEEFYGIGNLNIGKTAENYISNSLIQADEHIDFVKRSSTSFKGICGGLDETVLEDFYTYFGDECLKSQGSMESVIEHIDVKNFIDYYIFTEFVYADDDVDKNFIIGRNLDGKIMLFPYDLDSTFGLWWDGTNVSIKSGSVLDSPNVKGGKASEVWKGFYRLFNGNIKKRYTELRRMGVLTSNSVYKIAAELFFAFADKDRVRESERWSFSGIANGNSVEYFVEWTEKRIAVLDNLFGYSVAGNGSINQIIDDILGDEESEDIDKLLDTILE